MVSRFSTLSILFLIPASLYAQTCQTPVFGSTKQAALFDNVDLTFLVRQPDTSYYGVMVSVASLQVAAGYMNYQNVVLTGCAGAATPTTMPPAIPDKPPVPGVASQTIAVADFLNAGVLSAIYSASASPEPQVNFVNFTKFPAANTSVIAASSGVATLAVGDFNKDGKYDFVAVLVGDQGSGTPGGVQIFLGNGDGTFKTGNTYITGLNPLRVTVADFNGDGNLDLAVCGDGTSAVTILLGNGDGTFHATAATLTAGKNPIAVIAADFNKDKKLDLAVANEDGTISIFSGNGDGSFQTAMSLPVSVTLSFLAAADLNGDGNLDLAATDGGASVVAVLLGKGDGTFGPPTRYGSALNAGSLVVADFNNDGKLDLVVGSGTPDVLFPDFGSGNLYLFLGNGDGTFQGTPMLTTGKAPWALTIADLNGDGKPDVVVANYASADLSVFLGQGNGIFQAKPPYSVNASPGLVSVAAADFNGDGKIDVATVEQSQAFANAVAISLGNGDGTFQAPTLLTAGTTLMSVVVGDLNGDGKPDLVLADRDNPDPGFPTPGAVLVYLSTGSGFQPVKTFPAGNSPSAVAIKDVNLDGKPDLIVSDYGDFGVNNTGGVSILLGNGDGTFGAPLSYVTGRAEVSIAVADLNGDGKPDLVLPLLDSSFNYEVLIYLGKGDGTFLAPTSLAASQPNTNLIVADINGDGKPDLVLANCCGLTSATYFLGNGDGTFQPETVFDGGPSPIALGAADFNGDGKPDLALANKVANGLVILLNTSSAPPANITVNPNSTPQSAASGSAFGNALAVTVTDSSGHPVSGVSVKFTAPATGASATFPGSAISFTATTNLSGVATAATLTANATTGSYTVSDTSAGLPTVSFALTNTSAATHPAFFSGEASLGSGVYYLQFPDNSLFGYYNYVTSSILYHYDMGFEAFIPSTAGQIYFYDFATGHWWYSNPSLFPYLYDFTLNTFIYYFPDTKNAGHYTTNPRYFVNLTSGKIFTM